MDPLSRRTFLAGSAAAWTATSYAQVAGANERLRIGVIGCGGMATGHMNGLMRAKQADNIDIVAVSDVWDKRLEAAVKLTGGKPYKEYKQLLANKDIDYVLIASPEHWHYQMAADALDAGKHVYLEKPMTHKIEESKKLVERVKRGSLKLQVGVQGTSDTSYEQAWEYIKEGYIGKVVLAQIDYSRNSRDDLFVVNQIDPDIKPGVNLDWKAWLGPAPKRPWDPMRYFRWRNYWDYSGGIATDLFVHRVTRLIKAMNLTFPEFVMGAGGKYVFTDSKAEIPDTFDILADYPGGPTIQLVSSQANDTPIEHTIRGHKATLTFTPTGFTITPQRLFAKEVKEVKVQKSGREDTTLHHRNLQNAIRKNEALKCDCMLGYYHVVVCAMGVESFRKRQMLRWDKAKQKAVKA